MSSSKILLITTVAFCIFIFAPLALYLFWKLIQKPRIKENKIKESKETDLEQQNTEASLVHIVRTYLNFSLIEELLQVFRPKK